MFFSSCLKDERPAGAGLIMSSFRRMLNMVSWSSFLTNFIRDLEQNSFWNESHPNITDEGSISSHGCLNFGRIMAASRHPWLETEPKYHVNSRPLYLTIKKIYCLDHSVKDKIYYARNFFWCMKDGKKLKKVEKGPEKQDISVRTSVCVCNTEQESLAQSWNLGSICDGSQSLSVGWFSTGRLKFLSLEFWNLAVSQSLKFTILFPFCFISLMSFTGCYTEDEPKRQPFYVVGIMYMFWEVFTSYFEILKFSA